jgi:hypothetical protein
MDAHEFLKVHGSPEAESVAIRAGTNLNYFRQLACGARRPSVDLALRLVEASGHRLDFNKLLLAKSVVAERAA